MSPVTTEIVVALVLGLGLSLVLRLIIFVAKLLCVKRSGSLMIAWHWPQAALAPSFCILVSVVVFIAGSSLAWRSFAATIGFAGLWTITSMALITRKARRILRDKLKSSGAAG
jgi:hypothetical protein